MSKLGEKLKFLLGLGGSGAIPPTSSTMKPTTAVVSAVGAQITKISSGHIPMIRFRKAMGMSPTSAAGAASKMPSPTGAAAAGGSGAITEDWGLPQRFRRRPLDPDEIAYINRGGPE